MLVIVGVARSVLLLPPFPNSIVHIWFSSVLLVFDVVSILVQIWGFSQIEVELVYLFSGLFRSGYGLFR